MKTNFFYESNNKVQIKLPLQRKLRSTKFCTKQTQRSLIFHQNLFSLISIYLIQINIPSFLQGFWG